MAASTDSYKLFLQRLGRLKTFDEQLCFAYAMLLRQYRSLNVALKVSDTPRQVEGKVRRALSEEEIQSITADFERIRYGEWEPGDVEASVILTRICDAVKRYMF